jgi:hypothetical protein
VHLFPRLAGSALVQSDDSTTLVRVVLQGTRAVSTSGKPTSPAMPAFDWRLNDAQVACSDLHTEQLGKRSFARNRRHNCKPALVAGENALVWRKPD